MWKIIHKEFLHIFFAQNITQNSLWNHHFSSIKNLPNKEFLPSDYIRCLEVSSISNNWKGELCQVKSHQEKRIINIAKFRLLWKVHRRILMVLIVQTTIFWRNEWSLENETIIAAAAHKCNLPKKKWGLSCERGNFVEDHYKI